MRLEIESVGGGGRGVAHADGKVWFVADALPGEVVEAEPQRRRAGVVEARATAILQPGSPWREADPCPVASRCGGCDLAHVRREDAAAMLRELARGAWRHAPPELSRAAEEAPVVVSPLGWRMRARLHWDSCARALGFFGPRSRRTAEISSCRIVSSLLLGALPRLRDALAGAGAGDGDLHWLEDLDGSTAVAGWRGGGTVAPPVELLDGFHTLSRSGEAVAGGWGGTGVTVQLPVPLWVPIGAFFQGNRHLVPRLFARVAELARRVAPARACDLYGGVGLLAAAVRCAGVNAITLVEPSRVAARAAAQNLPGATVDCTTAEAWLAGAASADDWLAIIDAPRAGPSLRATDGVLRWSPRAILMLACDAARFGRDAARLLGGGYRLEALELWDLFAGSHHVEVLASFARSRA
jgi:23S rRNA (uracil1939-C5)-methyltransferase